MNSVKVLKGFRGKRLKTQDEVASGLGISRQVYCGYENNPLKCGLNEVFNILNFLEVNDSEICEFFDALKQDYLSHKKDGTS